MHSALLGVATTVTAAALAGAIVLTLQSVAPDDDPVVVGTVAPAVATPASTPSTAEEPAFMASC